MIESKFITIKKAKEEAKWLQNFREYFLLAKTNINNLCHYDNHSVIRVEKSSMYNGKPTHICHKHNIIKHLPSNKIISINYIKSKENVAYPITKGLSIKLVHNSSRKMGLKPLNIKEYNNVTIPCRLDI